MNIYDIAERAGVSIATVSRVLNGSSKVRPKTRQKIEQIIEECGYVKASKRPKKSRTHIIGIFVSTILDRKTAKLAETLEKQLSFRGYHCLLRNCGADLQELKVSVSKAAAVCDAVVIDAGTFAEFSPAENSFFSELSKTLPMIFINGSISGRRIFCISYDYAKSVQLQAEQYIKENKKNLLFLFSTMTAYQMNALQGFKDAFWIHGLDAEDLKIKMVPDKSAVDKYIHERFLHVDIPDAIIATSKELCQYALSLFSEADITVPGYYLEVPVSQTAQLVIQTLFHQMSGEEVPSMVLIPGTLLRIKTD